MKALQVCSSENVIGSWPSGKLSTTTLADTIIKNMDAITRKGQNNRNVRDIVMPDTIKNVTIHLVLGGDRAIFQVRCLNDGSFGLPKTSAGKK